MPYPKLTNETIDAIKKMSIEGRSAKYITAELGISYASALKYSRGVESTSSGATAPSIEVPDRPMTQDVPYQSPSISPNKLEERSILSPMNDTVRDQLRLAQDVGHLKLLRQTSDLLGGSDNGGKSDSSAMITVLGQIVTAMMSQQNEKGSKGSEEISILRFELEKMKELHEAEYRQEMKNRLDELTKKMSEQSSLTGERVQLTKIWLDYAEKYGLGSGDLRADALLVGSQLGGLGGRWKAPGKEYEPLVVPKKAKGILVPMSESQMAAMADNLERGEQSSKAEVMPIQGGQAIEVNPVAPASNDEVKKLRSELGQALRENAEMKAKFEAIQKGQESGSKAVIVGQGGQG